MQDLAPGLLTIQTMSPTVTKISRSLVRPRGTTPSSKLQLSLLDRLPAQRWVGDVLQVYAHGREPAKVIREALSRALCPYYPLAGRLVASEEEIACTGAGVWFIEASAVCSLDDVNYLHRPLMISDEDLLPYPRPGLDPEDAIVLIQVTEFTCGGFAVAGRLNHMVLDGEGWGQFLRAVSEIARGLSRLTVEPIWGREAIPRPPSLPRLPAMDTPLHLEFSTIDIPLDYITQMRRQFTEETGRRCSTFEVAAAVMWRCWTRVVDPDPHLDVHLGFTVNVRPLLHHILPPGGGYYGNCLYNMIATAAGRRIAATSMVEVVSLVKDEKERAPAEFWKWIGGELGDDPYERIGFDRLLIVVDHRNLGFSDADYGWGPPIHYGPVTRSDSIPSCVIVDPPAPLKGARLVTRAVNRERLPAFLDEVLLSLKPHMSLLDSKPTSRAKL